MSTPIAHFAVGSGTVLVLYNVLPLHVRLKRKIVKVGIVVFGGLWALVPDIAHIHNILAYINNTYWMRIRFLPQVKTPELSTFSRLAYAFHYSHWADIFFFHRLMDEGHYTSLIIPVVLFLVIATVLVRDVLNRNAVK